ncbi:type-F conjugative transfer system protein TraW [Duganella sp. Leaf126]|uniref:type-F conjugative transfer system protein TraW n=1 Tax=Duganella sp. Leaf126 TaxID=1736266 RepID=UPI001E4A7A03|nr:type-F conjugative transfer system protein TraW [Duganella sp. Leaf126]
MQSFNSFRSALMLIVAVAALAPARATDYGKIGPTYPVREPDMLAWIEQRVAAKVASGEALRHQQQQAEKISHKLHNPEPLRSVTRASKSRTVYYDPTFVVEENVTDDSGRILVLAGTTINPLERVGLSRPLVFFDARDKNQVAFAKRYLDGRAGLAKPILVGGSYFELMKQWQTPVYFDQQSALIRKLGIRHVPAIVVQDGKRLRIDEIAL